MTDKERTDIRQLVWSLMGAVRKEERHIVAALITSATTIDRILLTETARCEQALLDAIESLFNKQQQGNELYDDTYF